MLHVKTKGSQHHFPSSRGSYDMLASVLTPLSLGSTCLLTQQALPPPCPRRLLSLLSRLRPHHRLRGPVATLSPGWFPASYSPCGSQNGIESTPLWLFRSKFKVLTWHKALRGLVLPRLFTPVSHPARHRPDPVSLPSSSSPNVRA